MVGTLLARNQWNLFPHRPDWALPLIELLKNPFTRKNHPRMIRTLKTAIKRDPGNAINAILDIDENTPLHVASELSGKSSGFSNAEPLLQKGQNPKYPDLATLFRENPHKKVDATKIGWAGLYRRSQKLIQVLLENGADVKVINLKNQTPLARYCEANIFDYCYPSSSNWDQGFTLLVRAGIEAEEANPHLKRSLGGVLEINTFYDERSDAQSSQSSVLDMFDPKMIPLNAIAKAFGVVGVLEGQSGLLNYLLTNVTIPDQEQERAECWQGILRLLVVMRAEYPKVIDVLGEMTVLDTVVSRAENKYLMAFFLDWTLENNPNFFSSARAQAFASRHHKNEYMMEVYFHEKSKWSEAGSEVEAGKKRKKKGMMRKERGGRDPRVYHLYGQSLFSRRARAVQTRCVSQSLHSRVVGDKKHVSNMHRRRYHF